MYASKKDKEKIDIELKNKSKILKKMEDKITFIETSKNKKMKLNKKLERIDLALNDKNILEKEFNKANSKLDDSKKLKSIAKYKKSITI